MYPASRAERREAERHLARENARQPETLAEVPRTLWPYSMSSARREPERVYRSREFLVQQFAADAPAIARLSINRTTLQRDGVRWDEGLSWDDLMRVKRECGFAANDAVEVYPPDEDVVNVANMRHLWVLPAGHLSFAWRRGAAA